MKKTIYVTKRDIKFGMRKSCFYCPIALAADRVLVHTRDLQVGDTQLFVDGTQLFVDGRFIKLPPVAAKFIRDFDKSGPTKVKPFRFSVEI